MQVDEGNGLPDPGQAAPPLAPASTAELGAPPPPPPPQVKAETPAMSQASAQQLQLQQIQQQLMPPPPAVPPGNPQASRPGASLLLTLTWPSSVHIIVQQESLQYGPNLPTVMHNQEHPSGKRFRQGTGAVTN